MTNPTELAPQERNQFMMSKIRNESLAPYQEGHYVLRVASVPGRLTEIPRSWPIAISLVAGNRYICAPNRQRDWVRNLLAAGKCHIEGDPNPQYQAILIEDRTAATVVASYLASLGRKSTMWPFPTDASEAEIARHVSEIAVFRLDQAQQGD